MNWTKELGWRAALGTFLLALFMLDSVMLWYSDINLTTVGGIFNSTSPVILLFGAVGGLSYNRERPSLVKKLFVLLPLIYAPYILMYLAFVL
ncbi:MAG: hypothetical protein WCI89_00120 [bacterium]